ncbi:cupin [Streptomyces sp. CBMA152]|uniref:cupin n=1 Tax=Streptomyces sp. CBMA152 TaxID=1896312 RepID=UPI0016616C0F|nr:cupin [Streptomyces sp. CBMA152]MBD0743863.1 cupin [Streptomyces sp. CBMA152]
MQDLAALAGEHLTKARLASHGRSAHLIVHDGALRQSVIALTSGSALDEHSAPLASSLQVLSGHVRLTSNSGNKELRAGQLCEIPKERHGLLALEDSAVLLTAVTAVM